MGGGWWGEGSGEWGVVGSGKWEVVSKEWGVRSEE